MLNLMVLKCITVLVKHILALNFKLSKLLRGGGGGGKTMFTTPIFSLRGDCPGPTQDRRLFLLYPWPSPLILKHSIWGMFGKIVHTCIKLSHMQIFSWIFMGWLVLMKLTSISFQFHGLNTYYWPHERTQIVAFYLNEVFYLNKVPKSDHKRFYRLIWILRGNCLSK